MRKPKAAKKHDSAIDLPVGLFVALVMDYGDSSKAMGYNTSVLLGDVLTQRLFRGTGFNETSATANALLKYREEFS